MSGTVNLVKSPWLGNMSAPEVYHYFSKSVSILTHQCTLRLHQISVSVQWMVANEETHKWVGYPA